MLPQSKSPAAAQSTLSFAQVGGGTSAPVPFPTQEALRTMTGDDVDAALQRSLKSSWESQPEVMKRYMDYLFHEGDDEFTKERWEEMETDEEWTDEDEPSYVLPKFFDVTATEPDSKVSTYDDKPMDLESSSSEGQSVTSDDERRSSLPPRTRHSSAGGAYSDSVSGTDKSSRATFDDKWWQDSYGPHEADNTVQVPRRYKEEPGKYGAPVVSPSLGFKGSAPSPYAPGPYEPDYIRVKSSASSKGITPASYYRVTDALPPIFTTTLSGFFFGFQKSPTRYQIPGVIDLTLVEEEKGQARYDKVNIGISFPGGSVNVDGAAGLIRSWFRTQQWESLYRGEQRSLSAWDGAFDHRDMNAEDKIEYAQNGLIGSLFDLSNFSGDSEYVTVLTYPYGHRGTYGSLTKLRVTLANSIAARIEPISALTDVPKLILKKMADDARAKISIWKDNDSVTHKEYNTDGEKPFTLTVAERTTGRYWELGTGWRKGLGIRHDEETEHDGFVATIPQMLALLHLKTVQLYCLESSCPYVISCVDLSGVVKSETVRAVKITGIERVGQYPSNKIRSVVLVPDSKWAKERLIWA